MHLKLEKDEQEKLEHSKAVIRRAIKEIEAAMLI